MRACVIPAILFNLFLGAAGAGAQEPGAAVLGRVLGPGGEPVGGARIELHAVLSRYEVGLGEAEGQKPAPAAIHATTGPDGRFALRAPRPGMWRVIAAADGFVPQQRLLLPLLEDIELPPVDLPVDSGLRIRVLSPNGSLLAGARVLGEIQSRFPVASPGGWTPVERRGETGADGVVRLPKTTAETLRLWVAAPGFPVQEGPVTRAPAAVVRLAPGALARLEIREASDEPVSGALMRDLAGRFVLGRTGPDGRLTVACPSSGEPGALIEAADGRRAQHRWKTAAGADPARPQLVALPPAGSWSGRILDRHTRAPLPGAVVWPESDPGLWVRADAGGTFRLRKLALPFETALAAAALDHAPGALSFQSAQSGNPLVLALARTTTLRGTVVDARGRQLENVELQITPLGDGEQESHITRTSAEGLFRTPGLHTGASYLVTAFLSGFAPASTAVAIPKPEAQVPDLRMVLGWGRTASGQVVDERGRPVADARVELVPGTAGRVVASGLTASGNASQRAQTGADGRFELRHQPAGWFRLRIEADSFLVFEQDGLQIPASTARTNLGRFPLQRGAALRGWAGDPDGNPVAGAEVWILPAEVRDWADLYAQGPAAVTGADGSFLVRDLPHDDSFGLDICRAGYLPLSATVREIPEEPFRAVLRRAARLSGRVTADDGSPVPAARIESWLAGEEPSRSESLRPCRNGSGSVTTDNGGRFRFEALPPGWWNLRATASGYRSATRDRLHILAGESLDDVEIVLAPGAILSGRVFTSEGEPAAGAQVSALSADGTVQTLAGGDGAYRLAGVEPGERTIEATLEEGAWASRNLTVLPGENRLDLTLDQGAPHQEIHGRVLGPDGGPIAGATVLATGSARTFTAADGSFHLAVEDNRDYEIWAEKERFAAARAGAAVRVAGAPVNGVEIRLGRGGTLTGQILGLDREELVRVNVEVELFPPLQARAAVDPQGNYRIENLPPGEWTLTARAGDRTIRAQAVLPPDASDAAVDLVFEPSHEVSGWISSPAGEPVADAYIRFSAPGGVSSNTYSRSDGSFQLRLEDGKYRVVARREGYLWTMQEEPVAVEGGPVSGLELHLDKAAVIRGRILGLAPGERAKAVWASTGATNSNRREGQLDQEGGFVIPDIPPGDWLVTVAHGGKEATVSLHLAPEQEEQWVEVELGEP